MMEKVRWFEQFLSFEGLCYLTAFIEQRKSKSKGMSAVFEDLCCAATPTILYFSATEGKNLTLNCLIAMFKSEGVIKNLLCDTKSTWKNQYMYFRKLYNSSCKLVLVYSKRDYTEHGGRRYNGVKYSYFRFTTPK